MAALHQRTGASDPRVRRWAAAPRAAGGEVVVVCLAGRAPQKIPIDVPLNWPVWSPARRRLTSASTPGNGRLSWPGSGSLKVVRMPGLIPRPRPSRARTCRSRPGGPNPLRTLWTWKPGVRRELREEWKGPI
jgi:hypothetical protein